MIAAGHSHTCAVTSVGAALCWGYNGSGRLGDGSGANRLTPVLVSGLGSGVSAISPSGYHTCALTSGGAALCWGYNGSGQLGDGSNVDRLTPVPVIGLDSEVSAITGDFDQTCALTSGGTVLCWGGNGSGQLGDGTTIGHLTPIAVVGLGNSVNGIDAGSHYTCVVTSTGEAKCWGNNASGQLGDGTLTMQTNPVAALQTPSPRIYYDGFE